ncbi:alpha/beta hydrolase [Pseudomonas sp. GD04058]|uniref:alpha/beta hydrolase n=1 Tax=Pseudomonas sp. GD04058 TaxID=2975429 RepID=UPI002447DE2B|nr:alpha/beta hydrolase [Pseudomonas sp. GD04058]MDG9882447.1 alpha/beta hydrolase [Pseudomonas sp. GD04058]
MHAKHLMALITLGAALIGCTSTERVMTPYEEELAVDSPNAVNFHSMLYFPSGTALHYPGYVVALEKSPQAIIGGPKFNPRASFLDANASYFKGEDGSYNTTREHIERFQGSDWKAMFVSHILKNDIYQDTSVSYFAKSHCFVYNAYAARRLAGTSTDHDLRKISDWNACKTSMNLEEHPVRLNQLYEYGRPALDALQLNLIQDLRGDRYTHVLIVVMGWNTAQDEAIRNINDITGNLMAAAEEARGAQINDLATSPKPEKVSKSRFRPLVIGVTWPSFWTNSFTNFFSYGNKANDADEIGLSWLNKLINQTVPNALDASGSQARVVAIGHSFGARAMTRALFSSPALDPGSDGPKSRVDLAIGLQGAVSINRFMPGKGIEGAPYRDFAKLGKTHIALTASQYDGAAGGRVFWYDPSGSIKSWHLACDGRDAQMAATFDCLNASDTSASPGGGFSLCKAGDDRCSTTPVSQGKVSYIDASNGITQFNSPGSGGGAHSDIYRLPMGRLLWRLVEEYALAP